MKKGKLIFIALLSSLFVFYGVSPFCNQHTDGFSIARIRSELTFDSRWDPSSFESPTPSFLHSLLSQPFHYLACGGQSFAFASEDGNYVIKFFKHRFRKPYSYFYQFSLPKFLHSLQERKRKKAFFKLERDFNSYKLAFEHLKEESGLLYIHLNKGGHLPKDFTLVDKLGIYHSIDLNQFEFVLQKKADLAYPSIEKWIKNNDLVSFEMAMDQTIDLILSRCKKGIFDEDPKLHRNLGFIGTTPIFIDVGRFVKDTCRIKPDIYKQDLNQIMKPLRAWIKVNHPQLLAMIDEKIEHAL